MAIKPLGGATIGPGAPSLVVKKKVVPKLYNPMAYVPGGSSPVVAKAIQAQGYAMPNVPIPAASSIVQPNTIGGSGGGTAQVSADPYGDELRADTMYGIGQKNYADALSMGERTMLSDPINRLIQQYGYDPRTTALGDLASKYFDPAGLDAARKGGYTTAQQIERGFGQALAGIPTDLGMSGLQHSGSSAIIGDRLNYERGLSDKNAIDQLLSGVGTANTNWTDFQTQQSNAWRQAQEDIATRLGQQAGYHGETEDTGTPGVSATGAATGLAGLGVFPGYVQASQASKAIPVSAATKKTLNKVKKTKAPSGWAQAIAGMTGW